MTTRERYGTDRIVAFTDAVVAIAITVLLLPLAEVTVPEGVSLGDVIRENSALIGGLSLSWVIIAVFWLVHHRLFDRILFFDGLTVRLNFAWMFAVALMPLPTNILIESQSSTEIAAFYVGWLTLVSALLLLIQIHARRTPGMMDPAYLKTEAALEAQYRATLVTLVFFVCFLASLVLGPLALYGLFLQLPVDWLSGRLAARQHA
jgi:uncharacterized membrane protein